MTITIILTILLLLAVAAACWSFSRYNSLSETHRKLEYDVEQLRKTNGELTVNIARAEERLQLSETERQRERNDLENRFKAIANDILLNNSREISQQNTTRLNEVLQPMKENFELFRRTITESYDREARERFSLADRIKELMELNRVISDETHRLTDALKGNSKMQGDWGEMILENILERSGLERGREFEVQQTTINESGARLRPDVIINYPGDRKIIIDSKVSIQAYLAMLDTTDPEKAAALGKAHIASIKNHITELRNKRYQDYVGDDKIDFVMMFIPHEGAYLAAMQLDPTLWQTAYDSRVLIISPTHLMSVVKLVEQLWRHDRQTRNAITIAEEAGRMLDKFRGFIDDMDKMDRNINSLRDSWNNAFGKLSSGNGNLIGRAEKLRKLGVKATKDLPERYTNAAGLNAADDDIQTEN
jgi:DNA recombination protein RmuC